MLKEFIGLISLTNVFMENCTQAPENGKEQLAREACTTKEELKDLCLLF